MDNNIVILKTHVISMETVSHSIKILDRVEYDNYDIKMYKFEKKKPIKFSEDNSIYSKLFTNVERFGFFKQ